MNPPNEDPLKLAIEVKTQAEFMRLPAPGQADPIFGLKRSYLNLLILPSKENGYRPPVKSFVVHRTRGRKGVRLIELASLRAYLQAQMEAYQQRLQTSSGPPTADS